MIDDTLRKIEQRIASSGSMTEKNREELLRLLASLRAEITRLEEAHGEHAKSIAGHIERSATEAMREERDPETLKTSLSELEASVKDFEASHPQLAQDINTISTLLANMGL